MQSKLGLIVELSALTLPWTNIPLRDLAWFQVKADTDIYQLNSSGAREDGASL